MVYVQSIFDKAIETITGTDITASVNTNGLNFDEQGYSEATTPYIISQKVDDTSQNLFQFHSLSDGDYTNGEIKIGIFDVKQAVAGVSEYGTFGVVVRKLSDTDNSPKVLETFTECSIDPLATNYVAKKIGNRYGTFAADANGETKLRMVGDYEPKSAYIRVKMVEAVDRGGVSKGLVPFGFAAPYVPFTASANPPAMHYITSSIENDAVNAKIYKGVDLHSDYEDDNKQFLKAIPND